MSSETGEKDRVGDKLRDKERGEENRFFRDREREAIEKLRQRNAERDKERK